MGRDLATDFAFTLESILQFAKNDDVPAQLTRTFREKLNALMAHGREWHAFLERGRLFVLRHHVLQYYAALECASGFATPHERRQTVESILAARAALHAAGGLAKLDADAGLTAPPRPLAPVTDCEGRDLRWHTREEGAGIRPDELTYELVFDPAFRFTDDGTTGLQFWIIQRPANAFWYMLAEELENDVYHMLRQAVAKCRAPLIGFGVGQSIPTVQQLADWPTPIPPERIDALVRCFYPHLRARLSADRLAQDEPTWEAGGLRAVHASVNHLIVDRLNERVEEVLRTTPQAARVAFVREHFPEGAPRTEAWLRNEERRATARETVAAGLIRVIDHADDLPETLARYDWHRVNLLRREKFCLIKGMSLIEAWEEDFPDAAGQASRIQPPPL